MKRYGFTLAGGFSVARNEMECANVTTERNERNFLRKFLKWSYQVVTARKIQDGAFTLAEVLITLAIIGVVAAISIPSVISNSQQQEFKTGLRKAVSVLNSAITMNMALDGETPYDNVDLFHFLQRHMNIQEVVEDIYHDKFSASSSGGTKYWNAGFYTVDGMRFEFVDTSTYSGEEQFLHENSSISVCLGATYLGRRRTSPETWCGGCGSYGLNSNVDKTTKPPCLIMVDVNGDKKPNPANINCIVKTGYADCSKPYKYADPLGVKLTDLFSVMITDKEAIPYGLAAQKAMYQARK